MADESLTGLHGGDRADEPKPHSQRGRATADHADRTQTQDQRGGSAKAHYPARLAVAQHQRQRRDHCQKRHIIRDDEDRYPETGDQRPQAFGPSPLPMPAPPQHHHCQPQCNRGEGPVEEARLPQSLNMVRHRHEQENPRQERGAQAQTAAKIRGDQG